MKWFIRSVLLHSFLSEFYTKEHPSFAYTQKFNTKVTRYGFVSELQYLIPLNSYVRLHNPYVRRKKNIESKPIKNHFTVNTIESISFLTFECGNFHFFFVNLPSKCVNVWDFEMSVFMSTVNSFITYANQFRRLKLLTQIQTSIDQQNNFCFENFDFCFVPQFIRNSVESVYN